MELVIATNNAHKVREISAMLSELPLKTIPLSAYPDAPELKAVLRQFEQLKVMGSK